MEKIIKILVVEDDEVDCMAVRRALKTAGVPVKITAVIDCQSAIEVLLSQQPAANNLLVEPSFDCILLDYRLPDGDGLTLVREVRKAGIEVPLVVLTGQGDEEIAVELMKAGASDYLAKNKVSSETLSRSVTNAVRIFWAQREAALANQRLRESEERYRLVLEGSNDGIWDWDLATHAIYCNDRLYEITGLSPDTVNVSYELFFQLLHPDDRLRISQAVTAHLQNNVELEAEFRLLHSSGEYRYCIARGKAWRDESGRPFRMSGILSDITERKRAETSLRFLAEASVLLSASLDYEKTLESLAQLTVPFLADLCIVDIVENGVVRRMGVAYADPNQENYAVQEQLRKLRESYPPDLNGRHPAIEVLRTGVAKLRTEITDDELVAATHNAEHLEIVRDLGFKSYMIVPLLVRGRTLGSISLVSTQEERRYSSSDLALAEELARRAALSIENSQLYRETQETSENLRQAILILGEQQQQLRTLQQLTNLLNQRLTDLPGLLREMVEAVVRAIPGAQFCFIMLNNSQDDGMTLTVKAGGGIENLKINRDAFSSDTEKGLLARVFLTGESELVREDNSPELPLEAVPAAIYAVPINAIALQPFSSRRFANGHPPAGGRKESAIASHSTDSSAQAGRLGVLAIGNWDDRDAFDEDDRNLLVAVGEQAAIAIDNARMIKALEEQEERLEDQNEVLAQKNQELEYQRQQLQLNNLQLLEAARLKSQFLATMSHELRTPMNAVIGFSQLLLRQRQNPLTPQQADMMERILNNGKHLLTLINEILDLSKLEAGRLELKLEAFDLMKLVQTTLDELRSLADEKQIELRISNTLQNSNIINDSVRLRQILVNLVSNAIKFTEVGSVDVELKEVTPDRLSITVKDTGIGIAEDELEHIFEEFRQIDQTTTRRYAGTGLGLAITQSLVQMMQGSIEVESQVGQGSTFHVELPRTVNSTPSYNSTANPSTSLGAHPASPSVLTQSHSRSETKRMLY
jgi:PAS domain S-box-containing protein